MFSGVPEKGKGRGKKLFTEDFFLYPCSGPFLRCHGQPLRFLFFYRAGFCALHEWKGKGFAYEKKRQGSNPAGRPAGDDSAVQGVPPGIMGRHGGVHGAPELRL